MWVTGRLGSQLLQFWGRLLEPWGVSVEGSPGSSHVRLAVLSTTDTRPSFVYIHAARTFCMPGQARPGVYKEPI